MRRFTRKILSNLSLPRAARAERQRDAAGLPQSDPGAARVIDHAIAWLGRAQDSTASRDDGVARHYSFVSGWGTSYPETTGYIVPTMLDHAGRTGDKDTGERGRRMLDWLVAIQMPGGGFQGGRIDSKPVVPVTFNTGQILLGLAAGVATFGDAYRDATDAAARWLADSLDDDGCWRRHPTPFAQPGEKAYETHVSWGLFEAERVSPGNGFGEAGLRQTAWALTKQASNGWVADCCLVEPSQPLTHTLGYFLRGVVEAYRLSEDAALLEVARRTADGLLSALGPDGRLPGRLGADWSAAVPWVCLTGSVQIAHCWLMLFQFTEDPRYLDAARRANAFVRRAVRVDGPAETRGGVKGSFPVHGDYGTYEYLNWAAKFCIDSNALELAIGQGPRSD